MKNKKEINEEFWNKLDGWLSEGADKGMLSELFLGVGTQLAALSAGGEIMGGPNPRTTCEEYDGTSWTAGGSLSIGTGYLAGCGTQTAGLKFSGNLPSNTSNTTEEYNGTSWSSGGTLNESVSQTKGGGTLTAALRFGGET